MIKASKMGTKKPNFVNQNDILRNFEIRPVLIVGQHVSTGSAAAIKSGLGYLLNNFTSLARL